MKKLVEVDQETADQMLTNFEMPVELTLLNAQQRAERALPFIKAIAEGKTVEQKINDEWVTVTATNVVANIIPKAEFRIKPEIVQVKFRNALIKNSLGYYVDAFDREDYSSAEDAVVFVKWLGEEQTIEVEQEISQ